MQQVLNDGLAECPLLLPEKSQRLNRLCPEHLARAKEPSRAKQVFKVDRGHRVRAGLPEYTIKATQSDIAVPWVRYDVRSLPGGTLVLMLKVFRVGSPSAQINAWDVHDEGE